MAPRIYSQPRNSILLRADALDCEVATLAAAIFPVPASENAMKIKMLESSGYELSYRLRMPAEPTLPPIQEPPTPPENPDMPVREPDPDMPNQI